jgi:peroxiredoxin
MGKRLLSGLGYAVVFCAIALLVYQNQKLKGDIRGLVRGPKANGRSSHFCVGDSAALMLASNNGQRTSLLSKTGDAALLWIFDPGCPTCEREAENLARMLSLPHHMPTVLGISRGSVASTREFLTKHGLEFEVLFVPSNSSESRLLAVPQLLLIDRSGFVRAAYSNLATATPSFVVRQSP